MSDAGTLEKPWKATPFLEKDGTGKLWPSDVWSYIEINGIKHHVPFSLEVSERIACCVNAHTQLLEALQEMVYCFNYHIIECDMSRDALAICAAKRVLDTLAAAEEVQHED